MNQMLGLLLVLQAGVAVVTWSSKRVVEVEARNLVGFGPDDVAEVTISRMPGELKTDDGPSITIKRVDGGWVMPEADDFPLDTGKVNDMLGRLTLAKIRRPVASKPENHNALQVGPQAYDKLIRLVTRDDQTVTIYAGNAKGQSMHARFDGQDEVYLARGYKLGTYLTKSMTTLIPTMSASKMPLRSGSSISTVPSMHSRTKMAHGPSLSYHPAPRWI